MHYSNFYVPFYSSCISILQANHKSKSCVLLQYKKKIHAPNPYSWWNIWLQTHLNASGDSKDNYLLVMKHLTTNKKHNLMLVIVIVIIMTGIWYHFKKAGFSLFASVFCICLFVVWLFVRSFGLFVCVWECYHGTGGGGGGICLACRLVVRSFVCLSRMMCDVHYFVHSYCCYSYNNTIIFMN